MNVERFQKTVEHVGESLEPDADWMPTLFMEKDDRLVIAGLMIDIKNDHDKDLIAAVLTEIISQFKPDAVCFVTTSWALKGQDAEDGELMKAGLVRPSTSPNRIEAVCCYCYGVKGESDGELVMLGEIARSSSHPRILKWDTISGCDAAIGRFPEAIKQGFNLTEGGST